MSVIGNLNDIAQSFYDMYKQINSTVTETVGLDALWMRSIPYKKGEDVIFQEYTLLNVDCPKPIKIVANKTDYNPGNLIVDLYGVSYEAPFEISVDITTWKTIYGDNTMPQKDDIVYVKMLNKLFEVKSSTVSYTVAEQPTAYICQLAKYNPTSSRRESKDLQETIEDMTVSQTGLFGEEMTSEIFDITDPKEFDMTNLTPYDPYRKEFDPVLSKEYDLRIGNSLVSQYVYDFSTSNAGIKYSATDTFLKESPNWRSYMAWVRISAASAQYPITIKSIHNKDNSGWHILINSQRELEVGTTITIARGSSLRFDATVEHRGLNEEDENYLILVRQGDALSLSKKITNWHQLSGWSVSQGLQVELLHMVDQGKTNSISIGSSGIIFRWQDKDIVLRNDKILSYQGWMHICFQWSHSEISARVIDENLEVIFEESKSKKIKDSYVSEFSVHNEKTPIELASIRLYDSDGFLTLEEQKLEATTQHARNASRGIILDEASYYDPMKYIGDPK